MKAQILNVHDSHGSVFTLSLESSRDDKKVMEFLRKQLMRRGLSCFYIYKVLTVGKNLLHLSFSESGPRMAKVDGLWNPNRDDQKFPVLVLEDKITETVNGDYTASSQNLPLCHWCKKEVWGVNRIAVEVYVLEGNSFEKKLVQVHDKCQDIREKQIASIPFPELTITI